MGKFNSVLLQEIRRQEAAAAKQQELKTQLQISPDQDVVIVEKNNTFKFIARVLIGLIKTAAATLLFTLATIGLFTLLYEDIRNCFFAVLKQICTSLF